MRGSADAARQIEERPCGDGAQRVVLVAPDAREKKDAAWLRAVAREARDATPAPVLVVTGASRTIRDAMRAAGFHSHGRLFHSPDVSRSRRVVLLDGRTRVLGPPGGETPSVLKAMAFRAFAVMGVPWPGRTSEMFALQGAKPPFSWLATLEPRVASCSALGSTGGHEGAAVVLFRYGAAAPDLVVKVGGRADREGEALQQFGALAARAGARVPSVTWRGKYGGLPVLAQTLLAGISGREHVAGRRDRALALAERVAGWLSDWNRMSAEPRTLSSEHLEHWIMNPALTIRPALQAEGYVERLRSLCAACEGRTLPLVCAHNDLTTANLLVAREGPLGVIDWEASAALAPPLADLAYALADAAAAVNRYRDRPAAFAHCFGDGGAFAELTRRLLERAARDLGLDSVLAELCLQACWLGHAANEHVRRPPHGPPDAPFLRIVRHIAKYGPLWPS